MRIYMSFRLPDREVPGPGLTWLSASELFALLELDARGGEVSLARLKLRIERARSVLLEPEPRPWARRARGRRALGVLLDVLERARVEARAGGAEAFRWREDF